MRVIIAEGSRFPAILEAYHRQSIGRGRMLLGRTVERGAARGGFRPGAVADLPMVLIAPVLMTAIWKMTFGVVEAVTPEGFLAAPLDLIAHGLMGAPERPG